jgi:hypothetical protein
MKGLRRTMTERKYVKERGWVLARREANLYEIAGGRRGGINSRWEWLAKQLGSMFDHAEWYDWAGTRQPAAVIVHPYVHYTLEQVQAIANRYCVRAQVFRPSWWHNPEGQTIVFSAPRDGPRKQPTTGRTAAASNRKSHLRRPASAEGLSRKRERQCDSGVRSRKPPPHPLGRASG